MVNVLRWIFAAASLFLFSAAEASEMKYESCISLLSKIIAESDAFRDAMISQQFSVDGLPGNAPRQALEDLWDPAAKAYKVYLNAVAVACEEIRAKR